MPIPLPEYHGIFPYEFSFGTSGGAFEHEGAWLEDNKGESIWDHWVHENPNVTVDNGNGDVSADSYNHVNDDVDLLNNLGVNHFVFSISWGRIIPAGEGDINMLGINHYKKLIKKLRRKQIEPIVFLYVGDLPQALEDRGGFLSDEFPIWFREYARVAFQHFGDDVEYWLTFNNPTSQCSEGYGDGTYPPGVTSNPGVNEYICGHNLLKAHANAYHLYEDIFKPTQQGKISIGINIPWFQPKTRFDEDIEAVATRYQFHAGWFAHPIYKGDYPDVMIERVGKLSQLGGFSESRLPKFTRKDIRWIKGTSDFFAFGYFMGFYVRANSNEIPLPPSFGNDAGSKIKLMNSDVADGIRNVISWIQNEYDNPWLFITHNGYQSFNRTLDDTDRIDYIKSILINLQYAIEGDGARIFGYTHHSYIDGFVRRFGYTLKYGLIDVDFNDPCRTRTPRLSADYYRHVCTYGCIDYPCPPFYYQQFEINLNIDSCLIINS
ncbi:unnamed protein product [Phyllotreta striolata]|uniref:Glycoside hydrolase family 1 n=1 Tax=Phyllotreta striolata TaxID=444603 RepID=A0A9N9TK08_PHYSR|nr:unnamed protein product [Phyllotreta striolata]